MVVNPHALPENGLSDSDTKPSKVLAGPKFLSVRDHGDVMDQSIVRAVLAPTKLAWKSQAGRELDGPYGINECAMTTEITFNGQLEGRAFSSTGIKFRSAII